MAAAVQSNVEPDQRLDQVATTPSESQLNGMQSAPLLTDWDTYSRSYRTGPVMGKKSTEL